LAANMTLDKLEPLTKGGDVAKRKSDPTPNSKGAGGAKKPRKSRKKKEEELSPEEIEFKAKQKRALNKKGIWEVTIDDGVVIGLYEGTPQKIGAFVSAQSTPPPHSLYFQLTKIIQVPEQIGKESCCERRFTRRDNFCALCGQPKLVNPTLPEDVDYEIYT
jgi:hypothetical protein